MKKRINFIFAVCMAFSLALEAEIPANAASLTKLPDISSFAQDLTDAQYNVLCTGTYTAEKRGGVWYYKFTTKENYVYVLASAFFSPFEDDCTTLNEALTGGVANTLASCSTCHIYKGRSMSISYGSPPRSAPVKRTSHVTNIAYLEFYSSLSSHNVTLKCKMIDRVQFYFSDKVPEIDPRARVSSPRITPSTADQYVRALSRINGNAFKITPEFTFSVDNVGTNKVILKEFTYEAISSVAERTITSNIKNATSWIDVVIAVGKVTDSSTPIGVAVSLYSLYKTTLSFEKPHGSYYRTEMEPLSLNRKYCLKSSFTSPFKLKSDGDYWQVNINLSDSPSVNDIKTEFSVSFSASLD